MQNQLLRGRRPVPVIPVTDPAGPGRALQSSQEDFGVAAVSQVGLHKPSHVIQTARMT